MKRGLLWSVVATFCGGVGSLVVTPLLVARLGPNEFGLLVLVFTLASCASFFDLGLTWAAGRYFADDFATGRRPDLIGRFFTLACFLGGVGLLSVAGAVIVGPAILHRAGAGGGTPLILALVLAAVSFALTLQIGLIGTLLKSCQRFDEAGRVNAIGSILLPLGAYLAVSVAASLHLLLAVNILVNCVVLTLYVRRGRSELESSEPATRWAPRYLREMATFGGWTTGTRIGGILILQIDRLAVAVLGSVTGLTYYAVPASVASRVNAIGSAAAGLFFMRASALHAAGRATALRQQHAAATRLLTWVAVAAAAPLVLLGHEFLAAWIGSDMAAQGGPVLWVLALGYAVIAVGSLDAVTLEGCGRPDLTGLTVLAWSALAIVFVLSLGSTLGARAVAYAVGGWLVGVGLTNMALARAVVLSDRAEPRTFPAIGLVLTVAAAAGSAQLVRPLIHHLPMALAGLSGVGLTALGVGFLLILTRSDRALIVGQLLDAAPVVRMSWAPTRDSSRPADP